jgi:hypothetical protein
MQKVNLYFKSTKNVKKKYVRQAEDIGRVPA